MKHILEIMLGIACLYFWFIHITECATNDAFFFMFIGMVFFPIGMLNGIGISLGLW
jgi:hypothetical protein